MAYRIIVHRQAEHDIETAFKHIGFSSPQAARKWYNSIIDALTSLAEMPARCAVIPESEVLQLELRHLIHGKRPGLYRIIFRIDGESQVVHILTVRHGARRPLNEENIQPFLEAELE